MFTLVVTHQVLLIVTGVQLLRLLDLHYLMVLLLHTHQFLLQMVFGDRMLKELPLVLRVLQLTYWLTELIIQEILVVVLE